MSHLLWQKVRFCCCEYVTNSQSYACYVVGAAILFFYFSHHKQLLESLNLHIRFQDSLFCIDSNHLSPASILCMYTPFTFIHSNNPRLLFSQPLCHAAHANPLTLFPFISRFLFSFSFFLVFVVLNKEQGEVGKCVLKNRVFFVVAVVVILVIVGIFCQ